MIFFVYSASMIPLAFFASVFISTIRMAGWCYIVFTVLYTIVAFISSTVNMGMLIFVIGVMIVMILGKSLF